MPSAPLHSPTDPGPTPQPLAPAPPAPAGPGQGRGPRGERLVRHFKIDHRLSAEDKVQYEALLLDPRSTVDSLLKWLHDRGYKDVSRAGVQRHRKQFELDIKNIRHDARVAGQFAALARAQGGPTALADAGQFRFEQMFVEQLFRMKKTDRRQAKEWRELAQAMTALLANRSEVEQQRAAWERRAKEAADAVETAGRSGDWKLNGVKVADAVRRILGVPLPDEPLSEPDRSVESIEVAPRRPAGRLPSPSDN